MYKSALGIETYLIDGISLEVSPGYVGFGSNVFRSHRVFVEIIY